MDIRNCMDCRHCLLVVDPRRQSVRRGCCTLHLLMVDKLTEAGCSHFEPKVPPTPYLGYPRLLDMKLLEQVRAAMCQVENLLKALELQPRVEHPHDPGGELARGQREG